MKDFYKFLFYKMYRASKTQEESVYLNVAFIFFALLFELFHLLLFAVPLKYFGINSNINPKLSSILIVVVGSLFNYLFFINNNRIEKINEYYQKKQLNVAKGDLTLVAYVVILFVILFLESLYYMKYILVD